MIKHIFLDTTPLGLVTGRPGIADADACRLWLYGCVQANVRIYVPEIADYEVRRELRRAGKTAGITRLDAFIAAPSIHYLPLTTADMRLAAELWAQSRNRGIVTADVHALDGDVILCAQALGLGMPPADIVVATGNVKHIAHFIAASEWANIQP